MKKHLSTLAAVRAIPLWMGTARAQAPSLDARVNLRIAEQSLEDVVALLRDRSGAKIVVIDPKDGDPISKKPISIGFAGSVQSNTVAPP